MTQSMRGCKRLLVRSTCSRSGRPAGLAIQIEDGNLCERCIHRGIITSFLPEEWAHENASKECANRLSLSEEITLFGAGAHRCIMRRWASGLLLSQLFAHFKASIRSRA